MTRLVDRYGLDGRWLVRSPVGTADAAPESAEGSPRPRDELAERRARRARELHPSSGSAPGTLVHLPPRTAAGRAAALLGSYAFLVLGFAIPFVVALPFLWGAVWFLDLVFTILSPQPSPTDVLLRAAVFGLVFILFLAAGRLVVRSATARHRVALAAAWIGAGAVSWIGCVAAQRVSELRVQGGVAWELNLTAVLSFTLVAAHLYLQQWAREHGWRAVRRIYEA